MALLRSDGAVRCPQLCDITQTIVSFDICAPYPSTKQNRRLGTAGRSDDWKNGGRGARRDVDPNGTVDSAEQILAAYWQRGGQYRKRNNVQSPSLLTCHHRVPFFIVVLFLSESRRTLQGNTGIIA